MLYSAIKLYLMNTKCFKTHNWTKLNQTRQRWDAFSAMFGTSHVYHKTGNVWGNTLSENSVRCSACKLFSRSEPVILVLILDVINIILEKVTRLAKKSPKFSYLGWLVGQIQWHLDLYMLENSLWAWQNQVKDGCCSQAVCCTGLV